jgi:hypothetical protein
MLPAAIGPGPGETLTCTGTMRAGDRDRTGMTSLEGFGYRAADQPERR